MKKLTQKFLKNGLIKSELTFENINWNAKRLSKKLRIPKELYLELSEKFPQSKLRQDCDKANSPTTFMAGFVVGWIEKSGSRNNN